MKRLIVAAATGFLFLNAGGIGRTAPTLPDLALQPPQISTTPDARSYEVVRQGVPGIERAPNGRLWVVFGKRVESLYGYIVLVTSEDDGRTWSDFKLVIRPHGFVRAMSANLWIDPQGRMRLSWGQSAGMNDGRWGVWTISTNEPGSSDPRWTEPRRIADGIMLNKPTALRNGDWLLPIGLWKDGSNELGLNDRQMAPYTKDMLVHDLGARRRTSVVRSSDQGKTFELLGQADIATRTDENMIVERQDGSLLMLVRVSSGIAQTVSSDGRTWSPEAPYLGRDMVTGSARFYIRRLTSGALLMVRHDGRKTKTRSHLTAFVSDDDGVTWKGGLLLDERQRVTYPDGVQAPDGTIYVVYDYDRGKEGVILLTILREEDVRAGRPVSDKYRSRVEVNRALRP